MNYLTSHDNSNISRDCNTFYDALEQIAPHLSMRQHLNEDWFAENLVRWSIDNVVGVHKRLLRFCISLDDDAHLFRVCGA